MKNSMNKRYALEREKALVKWLGVNPSVQVIQAIQATHSLPLNGNTLFRPNTNPTVHSMNINWKQFNRLSV